MRLSLCLPVKQTEEEESSSPQRWNSPRWHSLGKSSRFRQDRKCEVSATHADTLMYHYIEFCFIQFWSISSLFPLFPSPAASHNLLFLLTAPCLSFLRRWWFMPVSWCATLRMAPLKQFSANGKLQFCMLKPSGAVDRRPVYERWSS